MTDRGKEVVTGIATGLLFWTVIFGTVVMLMQRACAS
jgi:TM2 domain-containing membrane protein YozV